MNSKLLQELLNFGLSDKEAAIYISLLETGALTVFEISKKSGINRSSAYVVLESLKKRGLVGISNDKKVRKYVASSPEILLESAKQESRKFENITLGLESIIPDLKALHSETKHKPIVKVFEGKNGLVSVLEDTLKCKEKKMRIISELEQIYKIIPEYVTSYFQKRAELGIKMYGIHPFNKFTEGYIAHVLPMVKIDEPLIIPAEKYTAPADFAIYDNKIGYMSAEGGGFGVIIEDKAMADVMKTVFDLAYEEAKRLHKELGIIIPH